MPQLGSDLVFEFFFFNEDGDPVVGHVVNVVIKRPNGTSISISPTTATQRGSGYLYTLPSASATALGSYEAVGTAADGTGLVLDYSISTSIVEPAQTVHAVLDKLNEMISGGPGTYVYTSAALVNTPSSSGDSWTSEDIETVVAAAALVESIKNKTDLIVDGSTPIYLAPIPGPSGTTLQVIRRDTYRNEIILTAFDAINLDLTDEALFTAGGFTFSVRDRSVDETEDPLFSVAAEAQSEHVIVVPLVSGTDTLLLTSDTKYIYDVQGTYVAGGKRTLAHGEVVVVTDIST